MAKVKGALFGLKTRGQLGKAMVYAEWRGVQYARSHVVPANPRTAEQTKTRSVFSWLNAYWRFAPGLAREPWTAFARGKPFTDRNALLAANIPVLREVTTIADFIASPGTASAPPLARLTVSATATSGQLVANADPSPPPQDWELRGVVFIALRNQDPHGAFLETIRFSEDMTAPYSATFDGLTSGQSYVVAAWPIYEKPDMTLAYGPSINALGTPA